MAKDNFFDDLNKFKKEFDVFRKNFTEFATDLKSGKIAKDAADLAGKDVVKDLNAIHKKAVDVFYNSYEPDYYDRQYSLYDMFDIEYDNGIVRVNVGPKYAFADWKNVEDPDTQHRVGVGYVYKKMFVEGWHGGATPTGKLDNDGRSYPPGYQMAYRRPVFDVYKNSEYGMYLYMKRFGYWSYRKVAKMSGSPMQIINKQRDAYLNNKKNTSGSTKKERIQNGINEVFSRYELFKK